MSLGQPSPWTTVSLDTWPLDKCLNTWLCDKEVKDIVKSLDSFIEDTPDVLRSLNNINDNETLPPEAKPISLDLKSMYTNIPIEEGIEAFREALDKRNDKTIPTEFVIKLLELVMKKNIFVFYDVPPKMEEDLTQIGRQPNPKWKTTLPKMFIS